MPYAADDMRAKLAQSAATTPEKFLAAEYEFHVFPPHDKQENSRTWYAGAQNFAIGYTELDSGSVRLERAGQPDEYVVLLMDDGLAADIPANDESKSVDGKTMIVVSSGDSSIDITGSGRIARLVPTSSADLAGLVVNAGSYEQPHENIPEFQARPDSPEGFKIRTYDLAAAPLPKPPIRLFRCTTFMVNFVDPIQGPGRPPTGPEAPDRDLRRACDPRAGLLGGAAVSASGTGDGASAALRRLAARRKFWGWGLESEGLAASEIEQLGAVFTERLGIDGVRMQEPPRVEELDLPAPRLVAPASLEPAFSTDPYDRAAHTYGRSFRDLVRAFRRDYVHAPDLVAFPRGESQLVSVLEWCSDAGVAAIPFGGGSSVVGGVEPDVGDGYHGVISVDLRHLQGVLEVDRTSRAARIAAGTLGPALEAQLKPYGLTLRHFPQSFEWSTLGGWIATRSGGHFATLHTHIDEFVEAVRVVTPLGVLQTRRLPASGAGPSAERLFCGSEGTLGVITEAWMRVQPRPRFRAGASVSFADFTDAVHAARELAQSGLHPANCRLLGHDEALVSGSGDGSHSILVLGFESADHELGPWLARALEICGGHRGQVHGEEGDPAAVWRAAFLRGGHLRDGLVRLGLISETFETAITWDRFWEFHEGVLAATRQAVRQACGGGVVSCRFAYVYPDGPSPYYSVFAPGRPGEELEQWDEIKLAASEAIAALGGTITHHHAVGRDHRRWYLREVPNLFADALRGAKEELDPAGIMNPGVLLEPTGAVTYSREEGRR